MSANRREREMKLGKDFPWPFASSRRAGLRFALLSVKKEPIIYCLHRISSNTTQHHIFSTSNKLFCFLCSTLPPMFFSSPRSKPYQLSHKGASENMSRPKKRHTLILSHDVMTANFCRTLRMRTRMKMIKLCPCEKAKLFFHHGEVFPLDTQLLPSSTEKLITQKSLSPLIS